MLQRVMKFRRDARSTRRRVRQLAAYLRRGRYVCRPRWAHLDDNDARALVAALRPSPSGTGGLGNGLTGAFRRALDVTCAVDGHADPGLETPFEGEALCAAAKGKTRIFDRASGLVLTVYPDQAPFDNEVRSRRAFGGYVPIPPVVETDPTRRLLVEQFIEPPSRTVPVQVDDLEAAMLEYMAGYGAYLRDRRDTSNAGAFPTVTTSDLVARAPSVVDRGLGGALSDLLDGVDMEFPLAEAHGDLWSANVVWGDDGWYVVDWDALGPRVFFCDAVSWFFIEAVRGRTEALDWYLAGKYDDRFEELFRILGLDFANHPREAYLAVYLLDRVTRSAEVAPRGWVPGMEGPMELLERVERGTVPQLSRTARWEDLS